MKRLLLVLVLLMTAGSLFAAELKITGDATVRGSTLNNMALAEDDEVQYSYFDYDFNLNAALMVNEKATVHMRLTYDKDVEGSGYVADGNGTSGSYTPGDFDEGDATVDPGDYTPGEFEAASVLNLERAYINYKFAPFLQLNTGLMGGGQWATSFNDNEANVMRVQFIGALSKDMIFIATYEKRDDWGAEYRLVDSEDNDTTVYYLASKMTFDAITVMPLLIYGTTGLNNDGTLAALGVTDKYSPTTMGFQLGLMGDFGMFGFEAEFGYTTVDLDGFADDNPAAAAFLEASETTTMGAYINAFAKIDALKAGLIFAYGSADEEDGKFNFGDDFDMFVVMDDFVSNTSTGLAGFTAIKLYADYTMDKITAMAAFGYGYNNADYEATEDATFMEFDLGAKYAFDENTAYTLMLGYAQTSDFYAADVDADAWRLYHKVSVKF